MLKQFYLRWRHWWHNKTQPQLPGKHPESSGAAAEQLAEQYLRERGLNIVARNYRCRGGEIDLIAIDHHCLVFIEVRLRRPNAQGKIQVSAAASLHQRKLARIIFAAKQWQLKYGAQSKTTACRFDVILFEQLDNTHLELISNAFSEHDGARYYR